MSMHWSIRVGVPTASDPEGVTGSGLWWVTGSSRPAVLPEYFERARARRARRTRFLRLLRRR